MAVRLYTGPLSRAPEVISHATSFASAAVGGGVGAEPVTILLATEVGTKLVVHAAYVVLRTAARGVGWAVVKVATTGASLGWCFLRSLFSRSPSSAADVPPHELPASLPVVTGAPVTPPIIDDYTRERRAAGDDAVAANLSPKTAPKVAERTSQPQSSAAAAPAMAAAAAAPPMTNSLSSSSLIVVRLKEGKEAEGVKEFEESLASHVQGTLEVSPAELSNFLSAYDRAHNPPSPTTAAGGRNGAAKKKPQLTPLEMFLRQHNAPPAPPGETPRQSAAIAEDMCTGWVELTSSSAIPSAPPRAALEVAQ